MSAGATKNRERQREIRQVPIPADVARLIEPGTTAFKMGGCQIMLSHGAGGWHMSISRPDKLPTWEEVRDARYALIPDEVTMAMLLPPRAEYVNVHDNCFQLWEVPAR